MSEAPCFSEAIAAITSRLHGLRSARRSQIRSIQALKASVLEHERTLSGLDISIDQTERAIVILGGNVPPPEAEPDGSSLPKEPS